MNKNPTLEAIFHAERFPVFAEHNDNWIFEPDTTEFSMVNAWWLCNLAQLSYYDEVDAKSIIEKMGFTLEAYIDDPALGDSKRSLIKDTQAYILSTDNFVVLAFRGTEPDKPKDILADTFAFTQEFSGKGKVFKGFYDCLSGECLEKITTVLNSDSVKDKPLWITGHSLGAALSNIAGGYFDFKGLYNFGSPRVGDNDYVAYFAGKNVHRFSNCADVVTHIPLKSLHPYHHFGTHHYLDSNSNHHISATDEFMNKDKFNAKMHYLFQQLPLPFITGKPLTRSLADHSIISYEYGIWKTLKNQ